MHYICHVAHMIELAEAIEKHHTEEIEKNWRKLEDK